MRIQLSLDQNTLRFYGDETSTLRVDSDDDIVFAFPVITTDFVTSGQLRVVQAGRLQQYPLVNSQASVPASTLVSGPFTISAVSNLYSTNELEFTAVVSYTGNEMSPIVNKVVYLNENQINIYNEDNSQYTHFIMARYYDGVDLSTKTCRVHWYSPDNNVADYDAVQDRAVVGDNIVFTWLIGNELTQYEGEIQFVVEFIGTDYVWKSKICTFTVENSLADTGGLTPAPTDQWYNSFVVEMDGKVATAEAWATGQKSGTDVPDTDPTYQNNAKYYAEQAADEADRAEDAADHAEEVVDHKAEIDGAYESMTVGNAEQLISSVTVNDKVPYNFRTSGGSIDIGNREVDKLVGGTVAWNQLVQNGDFQDTSNWAVQNNSYGSRSVANGELTYTISQVANNPYANTVKQSIGYIATHKYFVRQTITIPRESKVNIYYLSTPVYAILSAGKHTIETIASPTLSENNVFFGLNDPSSYGYEVGDTFTLKDINIFDLTQMFGSTIADYIYSLETATAGAGVAWFKKLFPKPYYAYNAGQLMSVKTSAHQMVGFNAWDEEWEEGGINSTTGATEPTTSRIRSKNFIKVIAGATYYFKCAADIYGYLYFYDADGNYLTHIDNKRNGTFIVPADATKMKFFAWKNGWTNPTYNHDICINLHWDGERDGEYEAYKKWTYPLDSDLELRGIPKLDASNNLYYDGDEYESDGTVTRNYGYRAYEAGDESLADAITDGTHTVYKLNTPTTEEADPYQNPQIVDDFGTEEYVDERTVAIPVGHDTEYMNNLKAKLEMAPDSPDGDGDYIVRQTNGENSYVPLMKELPTLPSEDGTYTLKCTVSSGTATLGWEREE